MRRRRKVLRRFTSATEVEHFESRILPATFTVTSLADTVAADGELTLREAIEQANDRNGPDTVVIAEQGRIRLEAGVLAVTDDLTIRGRDPFESSVDGQGATRLLRVNDASLTIEDITLVGGKASRGAAVFSNGEELLEVTNVRFLSNEAESRAGAIETGGDLIVRDSFFRDNSAEFGGAIYVGDHGTIVDSVFNSNTAGRGAALYGSIDSESVGFDDTTWEISGSRFLNNTATSRAGNIVDTARRTTIVDSVFMDNTADSGVVHAYNVSVTDSSIYSNDASGIVWAEFTTVTNSSILDNTGAGITSFWDVRLYNSTIHGNGGNGVFLDRGTIQSSIVVGNDGDDVGYDLEFAVVTVQNSLLGSNSGNGESETGSASPDNNGNFIGSTTSPLDPGLLPVGQYGTGHWVAPLDVDSLAINSGVNTQSLDTDVIGGNRVNGSAIDMGSVEFTSVGISVVNRVLKLAGTGGDDQITARLDGEYIVIVNGAIRSFDPSVFDSIEVRGLGGDDLMDLTGVLAPTTISGGSGNDTVVGGEGADKIGGGRGNDELRGASGADSILGGTGNDILHGSHDNDELNGEKGNDLIYGGTGQDMIRGFSGNDTLLGGSGNDVIFGGSGNDSVRGGANDDSVLAGSGNDTIVGVAGNDFLNGGNGRDLINGGVGDDYLFGEGGRDTLFGSDGNDILVGGRSVALPTFSALDAIWQSSNTLNSRINRVRELFPGEDWAQSHNVAQAVVNDSSADELNGQDGIDFFYARRDGSGAADVFDRDTNERFENL